jgi:hypothetical protein
VSRQGKWEYLRAIHARYRQAPHAEKERILDEFCQVTGYHRKSALRLLNGAPPHRRQVRKGHYGRTNPGTLLKHPIPLRTDRQDVTVPGFTEVDQVAHSGDSGEGEFVHSLNQTDLHTTWVETRAVLGRG